MADAIVRLLKDEALRERMGTPALALVTRFSAERMVRTRSASTERVVQVAARATSEGWQALGVGPSATEHLVR